ncbi:MAG: hypothetical protein KUG65_08485 [Sphingomonadaceae bacterium]|nr:hypothetical protein [Sphingomonadaceae bacterium]
MRVFEPSRSNGELLRREMDAAMWQSAYEALARGGGAPVAKSALSARASPADYAAYSDLVLDSPKGGNLSSGIQENAAITLRNRLSSLDDQPAHNSQLPRFANFDSNHYLPDELERMLRWWDTEDLNPMGLAPVCAEDFEMARLRIVAAFGLMKKAVPELYDETLAIVDEIVLVCPDGSQRFDYSAGSSFALWGGVLFNASMHGDWTRYFKNLVHESGHSLLFGVARDGGLVLNDTGASYASPVRDDPRPMDGIFHAAFVSARESLAFNRLLAWNDGTGELNEEDIGLIDDILEESVITFWQCHEALEENATMTPLGKDILTQCQRYMRKNFELMTE